MLLIRSIFFGTEDEADRAWMLVPGLLLLGVPFVYRNSFSYLMPTLMLVPILFAGLGLEVLERKMGGRANALLTGFCGLAIAVSSASYLLRRDEWSRVRERQEELIIAVHKLFPTEVNYIDRCGMVSSFPHRGLFMSSWVMGRYHRERLNQLRLNYEKHPSALLIANVDALKLSGTYERTIPDDSPQNGGRDSAHPPLFESDWRFLRENFVPYSGPLFLAGRRLPGGALSGILPINLAGRYQLVAGAPLLVEGQLWNTGATREFAPGRYFVFAEGGEGSDRVKATERIVRLVPPGQEVEVADGALFWR